MIKVVDLVFEVVDARCPIASRGTAVENLISGKQQILVLNKADLADPKATQDWLFYFKQIGIEVVAVDSKKSYGFKNVWDYIEQQSFVLNKHLQVRGRRGRQLRAAVVGIPNTGKSTFLNRLVGRSTVITGDRPGITKGPQWVHLKEKISVLDTPGILQPEMQNQEQIFKLVAIGALEPGKYDLESICLTLIEFLETRYKGCIAKALGIKIEWPCNLEFIAKEKKFVLSNGIMDTERAARFMLDQFRSGKLGAFTLEFPK